MSRLLLRFEHMPERHAELAYRFGEPDEAFESDHEEGHGSRWVLASPLSAAADIPAHFAWASDQLHPHEAFVGELVSLGGRVVLQLLGAPGETGLCFQLNARLLLPMAHAGVVIEFTTGS